MHKILMILALVVMGGMSMGCASRQASEDPNLQSQDSNRGLNALGAVLRGMGNGLTKASQSSTQQCTLNSNGPGSGSYSGWCH